MAWGSKSCVPPCCLKARRAFYAKGVNYYNYYEFPRKHNEKRDQPRGTYSRHAEVDAVLKLRPTRKRLKVNVLVTRTTSTKHFANARPCEHCESFIRSTLREKGYKLHRIYYTDANGELQIVKDLC